MRGSELGRVAERTMVDGRPMTAVQMAEKERYHLAFERVVKATSSASAKLVDAPRPDEEPRVELSLAEYERMSRHLETYGDLRAAIGKLL